MEPTELEITRRVIDRVKKMIEDDFIKKESQSLRRDGENRVLLLLAVIDELDAMWRGER